MEQWLNTSKSNKIRIFQLNHPLQKPGGVEVRTANKLARQYIPT